MLGAHPGITIFDFDGDCDLDIFVSNTIGHPNSLFENQLNPKNCGGRYKKKKNEPELQFQNIASTVGSNFTLTDHESAGSCYGDIDNDGDDDLVVLGRRGHVNFLFINNGDGTFSDAIQFDPNDPEYSSEGTLICSVLICSVQYGQIYLFQHTLIPNVFISIQDVLLVILMLMDTWIY